jgi:phosphate-selective porin OprO and OprP
MILPRLRTYVLAVAVSLACPAMAAEPANPAMAELQQQIQALQQRVNQQATRISELEQKQTGEWVNAAREDEIRKIVQDVIADAKKQSPAEGATFGYNNGFFIQSADKNFRLSINGFVQARYTVASDHVRNASSYAAVPVSGDVNGFDFRRARLIFNGNAFTPDLTYCFVYDFAGDACDKNPISAVKTNSSGEVTSTSQMSIPTDKNYGQIVDLYVAYRVNDLLNVRVGAFLTPFTRAEYLVGGAQFPDLPNVVAPFDPVRSNGLSLYGQPIKDHFAYELNINNGQCSNTLGRAGEVSTSGTTASNGGNNDNRMAFYLRLQYAGAGKLSDFADEPDLRKDNRELIWLVDGAVGYESANTSSSAYPSPQGAVTAIPVGARTAAGFVYYPLNGDLFRATIDAAAKMQGWSFTTACYFQQINENPAVAGSTAPALPGGYSTAGGSTSFFELGYYGQTGYMLTKQLELVARAGQLLTEGSSNTMEEYAMGLNYYFFGQNLKIQADVTYIPNAAAYTSSVMGSAINTEDLIFRTQLQLKF